MDDQVQFLLCQRHPVWPSASHSVPQLPTIQYIIILCYSLIREEIYSRCKMLIYYWGPVVCLAPSLVGAWACTLQLFKNGNMVHFSGHTRSYNSCRARTRDTCSLAPEETRAPGLGGECWSGQLPVGAELLLGLPVEECSGKAQSSSRKAVPERTGET